MSANNSKREVFINAPLSTLGEQNLNAEIHKLVEQAGFRVYLPQRMIPPSRSVSSMRVLEANVKAVEKSDIILTILDKPGLGVAFELGYALARKKDIIAFRSDPQDYLGKIVEGFWKGLSPTRKATDLRELRSILGSRGGKRS